MNVRFLYEAPEDGGGAPDGGDPPAGWQPTEEWGQRIDQYIEQSQPILTQLQEVLATPQDPGYDPSAYDPNYQPDPYADPYAQPPGYDPQIEQLIEERLAQRMGAYEPLLNQMAEERGEQIARTELEKLQTEVGAFDQDQAVMMTRAFMAQGVPPQEALRQAAQYAHSQQAKIEEANAAAVEEYKKSLGMAAEAAGGLDGGVPGAAVPGASVPTGRSRYEDVMANFDSRMNPLGADRL